jgi:predicted SAM-dependent methyltransferase
MLKLNKAGYEYITCSHVIEHVHSPVKFIAELRELLAPHGTLWIQTPNLASFGHSRYGAYWRGLEPPRHLCIFNLRNLTALMKNAGFNAVFHRLPALMAVPVHLSSMDLAQGKFEAFKENRSFTSILTLYIQAFWQSQFLDRSEFITLTATRVD